MERVVTPPHAGQSMPSSSKNTQQPLWLVKIGGPFGWSGTGFAIDPFTVVTCHHVLQDLGFDESSYRVQGNAVGQQDAKVAQVFRHEENDIALIRLKHPLDCQHFPTLCIADTDTVFSSRARYFVCGWPQEDQISSSASFYCMESSDLNYQPLMNYGEGFFLTKLRALKAPGSGMSGGPLVARLDKDYIVAMNYTGGLGAGAGEYLASSVIAQFYVASSSRWNPSLKTSVQARFAFANETLVEKPVSTDWAKAQQRYAKVYGLPAEFQWHGASFVLVPPGRHSSGELNQAIYVQAKPANSNWVCSLVREMDGAVNLSFDDVFKFFRALHKINGDGISLLSDSQSVYIFGDQRLALFPEKARESSKPIRPQKNWNDIDHPLGLSAPCARRLEAVASNAAKLQSFVAARTPKSRFSKVCFSSSSQATERLVFRCVLEPAFVRNIL